MAPDTNICDKAPMKILLVDDDAFVHEMLNLLINPQEFALHSASNVKEAMELIAGQSPDIVITDGMMPGESGFCLIEKIKSNPRTADIPVILMTILQLPDGSAMDASGKADFCVNKPVYLSDIASALEKAKQLIEHRQVIKVHLPESPEVVNVQLPEPPDKVTVIF